MRTVTEWFMVLFVIAIAILMVPVMTLYHTWAFITIWGWFLVPFGLPKIGWGWAYGLTLFTYFFKPHVIDYATKKDLGKSNKWWEELVRIAIPALIVLEGWIVKTWFM